MTVERYALRQRLLVGDVGESAWRDEERTSKRRRQEHQPDEEGTVTRIKNTIERLRSEIMKVAEVAKERNTKKEVKEVAAVMKRLIAELTADDAHALLQKAGKSLEKENLPSHGKTEESPTKEEILARLKEAEEESRSLKERNSDLERQLKALKEGRRYVSEEMFLNKDAYEDFLELECLEWPSKIYKAVTPAVGTLLMWRRNTDHLVAKRRHEKSLRRKIPRTPGSRGWRGGHQDMHQVCHEEWGGGIERKMAYPVRCWRGR